MNTLANPVIQAYLVTLIVLGLNLLVLANNTAVSRAKSAEVINPEDMRLNPKATVVLEAGNDRTARYRRAHRNALENIPLFLISGFMLTLTPISWVVAAAIFGTFTAARVLHSICYVAGIQPWRTASFAIGALTQFGVFAYLGYALLSA